MSAGIFAGKAAFDVVSGYYASQNIKATAKLNRDIAEMNAEFAELDAYNAKTEGFSEIARYQKNIDATLGEQQARLTGADVDVNYGSAADFQSETAFIGELNKMELEKQAEESAIGFKNQAREYRMSGQQAYGRGIQEAATTQFQSLARGVQSGAKAYSKYSSGY